MTTANRTEPKVQALSWLVSQLRWEETLGGLRHAKYDVGDAGLPRRPDTHLLCDVDCGPPPRLAERSAPTSPVGAESRPGPLHSGGRNAENSSVQANPPTPRRSPARGARVQRAPDAACRCARAPADDAGTGPAARRPDPGSRRLRRRADRGAARAGPPDPQRRRLADPVGSQPDRLPVPRGRRHPLERVAAVFGQLAERQPMTVAVALCHLPSETRNDLWGASRARRGRR